MRYKVNGGGLSGLVALTANTAAWALDLDAAANSVIRIRELRIATQSADGSQGPMLVEIVRCDSHAGSAGTSITPVPENPAHTASARFTAKRSETVGALTNGEVVEERLIPVQGETEFVLTELTKRWESKAGGQLIVRVTAPNAQNVLCGADVDD